MKTMATTMLLVSFTEEKSQRLPALCALCQGHHE